MLSESASSHAAHEEYSRRLQFLQATASRQQRRVNQLGYSKLFVTVMVASWVLLSVRRLTSLDLLLFIPIAIFILLAVWQDQEIRSLRYTSRGMEFYQRGLLRLNDSWPGSGESGERFLDAAHPYARDLDLFGRGSLFELLCTARTRPGEETLAQWLLTPASLEEIRDREAAIAELRDRLGLREALFTLGQDLRAGVRPEQLIAWGEQKPVRQTLGLSLTAAILAALWLINVVAWACAWCIEKGVVAPGLRFFSWGNLDLVFLMTLVNLLFSYRYRWVQNSAHAIEEAGVDLNLLSEVLSAFEAEPFVSHKLVALQLKLRHEDLNELRENRSAANQNSAPSGAPNRVIHLLAPRSLLRPVFPQPVTPSTAIKKLENVVQSLESGHNLFVRIFDPVMFWTLQWVLSAERWKQRFGPSIRDWIEAVGEMEALSSFSSYAYEHPDHVFAEFVDDGVCLHAEALAHPLLGRTQAISNDLHLDEDVQAIILSGPNMAGKSTFLRGIGVNVVLAQAGAPVRARRMRLSRLAVTASICVLDSLQGGTSRFYAEIKRLKQISDLTRGSLPVLFLLDELFSGTNSYDRLTGTRSIVKNLVDGHAIGLVTTHDLALTRIPEELGAHAINCHFEDRIENGELRFDYKLRPGVVQTSNALQLMRSIGLEV